MRYFCTKDIDFFGSAAGLAPAKHILAYGGVAASTRSVGSAIGWKAALEVLGLSIKNTGVGPRKKGRLGIPWAAFVAYVTNSIYVVYSHSFTISIFTPSAD